MTGPSAPPPASSPPPASAVTARGAQTRLALIRAAESLFATQGIDNTSVAAITKAAGQRNNYAIGWHFGGKDELLAAVLLRHQQQIDRSRTMILDAVETSDAVDVRTIAHALVAPLVDRLRDADGGPAYLRIQAELQARPGRHPEPDTQESARRLWRLGAAHLHFGADASVEDVQALVVSIVFHGLADFAVRCPDADAARVRRFELLLVDTVADVFDRQTQDPTQ